MTTPYLLNHLIESAAEKDPGHLAFKCRDEEISYEELAQRSLALRHPMVERDGIQTPRWEGRGGELS